MKSLTRDERLCWAPPAHPQLNQQRCSKSGISSWDRGCAAAGSSLQWQDQGQWVNSTQVDWIILFGRKSGCYYTDWALPLAWVWQLLSLCNTEEWRQCCGIPLLRFKGAQALLYVGGQLAEFPLKCVQVEGLLCFVSVAIFPKAHVFFNHFFIIKDTLSKWAAMTTK